MLLLLWLSPLCAFVQIRLRGFCSSACLSQRVFSTEPLRPPVCSVASGALFGLSTASRARRVVLDMHPSLPEASLSFVGSPLISRPARQSHTHAPGHGAPGISGSGAVDLLSRCLSWFRYTKLLKDSFVSLSLVLAPVTDVCPWQEDMRLSALGVQGSGQTILTRPAEDVDFRVLHPPDVVAMGLIHKFGLSCGLTDQVWCAPQCVLSR